MLCTRCNTNNRLGRRFCSGCGEPLAQACPLCGFENVAEERFCGGCGANLSSKSEPKASDAAPGTVSDYAERRQVTILFADMSNFTRLTTRNDPEETHRILGEFFETVDQSVSRFGGAIERHIGDNVMGVFGAPIAHDDDPLRAIQSARDIHNRVRAVAENLGIDLSVHIGIASGLVMASSTGSTLKAAYGVVGGPVNLASRLQSMASAGETLVSDPVKARAATIADFAPMGDMSLKGIDAPVRVWRYLGGSAAGSSDPILPMIGRIAERETLKSSLRGVLRSGQGGTLYVRGEAGVGKTRLIHELKTLAREEGYTTHSVLVLDFGVGQGRDAVYRLVADVLGVDSASFELDRRNAIERAVELRVVAQADIVFLNDILDVPQSAELRAIYDAMDNAGRNAAKQRVTKDLIKALSTFAPLLMIVEDLHWADVQALDNLAAVGEIIGECRAILALTSRLEGDPLDSQWRARVRSGITTIDLGPLRTEEALAFADQFRASSDPFVRRCVDRAEGNPLFLEQLLRNREESHTDDDVPASVQSLVLARLDRLPNAEKLALQAASIAGQRFSIELLRKLLKNPTLAADALLRNNIVRRAGEELMFAHALLRDAVYSSVTHERRKTLHNTAADFYAGSDLILRAEHLAKSDDPEAAEAYLRAAASEAEAYRYERALTLAERGRSIAKSDADRFRLDAFQADALRETGKPVASLELWIAALKEAQTPLDHCRAHIGIAAANRMLSRTDAAISALGEAEEIAKQESYVLEQAQVQYHWGNVLFATGNTEECLRRHEAALREAKLCESPEWQARASSGIGDALYSFCRMRSALAQFQTCVQVCERHGFGRIAIPNRLMMGHCMCYIEPIEHAVALIDESLAAARNAGNPHAEMFALVSLAVVLTQAGRFDVAWEPLGEALQLTRQVGARRYESQVLAFQAENLVDQNKRAEALPLAEEAVTISRQAGMGFVGPTALAILARTTADMKLRDGYLAEGESLLQGSVGHNRIWYYRVVGEIFVESGMPEQARRAAMRLRDVVAAEPLPLVDFIAARLEVLADRKTKLIGASEQSARLDDLIRQARSMSSNSYLAALERARESVSLSG